MKKRAREEKEDKEPHDAADETAVVDPKVGDEEREQLLSALNTLEQPPPQPNKKPRGGAGGRGGEGSAAAGSLRAIYGEGAAATVELKPELAHNLKLASVHELITWVMTDHGSMPRWVRLQNTPRV
jgi:hypothetical protein